MSTYSSGLESCQVYDASFLPSSWSWAQNCRSAMSLFTEMKMLPRDFYHLHRFISSLLFCSCCQAGDMPRASVGPAPSPPFLQKHTLDCSSCNPNSDECWAWRIFNLDQKPQAVTGACCAYLFSCLRSRAQITMHRHRQMPGTKLGDSALALVANMHLAHERRATFTYRRLSINILTANHLDDGDIGDSPRLILLLFRS